MSQTVEIEIEVQPLPARRSAMSHMAEPPVPILMQGRVVNEGRNVGGEAIKSRCMEVGDRMDDIEAFLNTRRGVGFLAGEVCTGIGMRNIMTVKHLLLALAGAGRVKCVGRGRFDYYTSIWEKK